MPAPKKVTLYSEGFGNDTKIINEDGEIVNGVYSAEIFIEAGNFVKVELVLNAMLLNIHNATVSTCELRCTLCGEIEKHTCS